MGVCCCKNNNTVPYIKMFKIGTNYRDYWIPFMCDFAIELQIFIVNLAVLEKTEL